MFNRKMQIQQTTVTKSSNMHYIYAKSMLEGMSSNHKQALATSLDQQAKSQEYFDRRNRATEITDKDEVLVRTSSRRNKLR